MAIATEIPLLAPVDNVSAPNPILSPGLNPLSLIMHILGHPKVRDFAQLALVGLLAEATRRWSKHLWGFAEYWLFLTSTHKPTDDSHDWLMAMWVRHPSWVDKCRRFECETSMMSAGQRSFPWLMVKEKKKSGGVDALDRRSAPEPHLIPPLDTSHWIVYDGTLVRFWRREKQPFESIYERGKLQVSVLGFRRKTFAKLLKDAKIAYAKTDADKVQVSVIDEKGDGGWRQIATRQKRRLDTVVCEAGVVEQICEEVRDFLDSEGWYLSRGVPWRRGYLFEGTPGSGKTSLVHAIASHFDMSIYVVSLATSGLSDSKLARCMTMVPAGAIVVMEDIDVSMSGGPGSLQREGEEATEEVQGDGGTDDKKEKAGRPGQNTVTLSGLLNAIDGVVVGEGRILFMTTNCKNRLDKALIRPGRADASIEFKNASQDQAERLFRSFYPISGAFPVTAIRRPGPASDSEKLKVDPTAQDIEALAKSFGRATPDRAFSVADLQCFLLKHKRYPGEALDAAPTWISNKQEEARRDAHRQQIEAEARVRAQLLKRVKRASLSVATSVPEPKSSAVVSFLDSPTTAPLSAPLEIVLDGKSS